MVAAGSMNGDAVKVEDIKVKVETVGIKGEGKDDFWASIKAEEEGGEGSRSPSPSSGYDHDRDRKPFLRSGLLDDVKEREGSRPPISRTGSFAESGTSTPRGSTSKASGSSRVKKEVVKIQRPLIDDLPVAWDAAHETFDVLEACVYENKKMGLSREQDEMMVCDCSYDKRNPGAHQCGPDSDCVNRAIFIECLPHECRAHSQCQNQRFAKRQFGDVDIVLTEKKGFGLRASADIPAGTLIYEYIGEVVQEKTFRQRMIAYSREGIKHFYFMMLQKEEYIDATKKGGIGRFANHSCNPNCEVQKWVVGRRLRMGIFSKRAIDKGEEVTFNYNVDRYGHDAQTCYCGEPNCVGTIGGKTQTDIAGLDDLFIDALGISDQVEAAGAKGNRKKKSQQLGEDFIPILHPIPDVEQASKVAAAIRQSADKARMMGFLLQRVQMTHDKLVHRQLVRAHGFSMMSKILSDMSDQRDIILLALQSMAHWQLQYRNKVADSNVEESVKLLVDSRDAPTADAAKQLMEYWSSLDTEQRITRVKLSSLDAEDEAQTRTIAEAQPYAYPEIRRPNAWENTQTVAFTIAPVQFRAPPPSFVRPPPPTPPIARNNSVSALSERSKLDAIIAQAAQFAPTPISSSLITSTPGSHSPAESSRSRSSMTADDERRKRFKSAHATDDLNGPSEYELHLMEEEAAKKEKRMMKLIGEHVVQSMNKYKEMMDHETFKRYAKECTQILVDKEKRGSSYANTRHPTLNDDKRAKIKSFTKEFVHKVLKRLKEKGKLRKLKSSSGTSANGRSRSKLGTSQTSSSTGPETPNGTQTDDVSQVQQGGEEAADDMDVDMEMDLDDIFGKDDESRSTSVSGKIVPLPTPSPLIPLQPTPALATTPATPAPAEPDSAPPPPPPPHPAQEPAPAPAPPSAPAAHASKHTPPRMPAAMLATKSISETPRRLSTGGPAEGLAPVDRWCAPKAPKAHLAAAARQNGTSS